MQRAAKDSFQLLNAEQQRNIARHRPKLMKSFLRQMSYQEWWQYKGKQRVDKKCWHLCKN